jgi:3D (Asp-Asp-Asp) domain-containing protein
MRLTLFLLGVPALLLATSGPTEVRGGNSERRVVGDVRQASVLTTRTTEIPFQEEYVRDRNLRRGAIKKVSEGRKGRVTCMYRQDAGAKSLSLVYKKTEPPHSAVYLVGAEGYTTSRGSFVGRRTMTMVATAYNPRGSGRRVSRTASGLAARYGVVAVDPRVIRLGTRVYVEGYGYAIAADTGGKIKGKRIDLCHRTRRDAKNFGRKKVRVHILK